MYNTTKLTEVLLDPELKKGLIVAPIFSGVTSALYKKAVALVEEGKDVLFVKESFKKHELDPSFKKIIQDTYLTKTDTYLGITPSSVTYDVKDKGSLTICGLDYTPLDTFDTVIVDSCASPEFKLNPYLKSIICVTTVEDLIKDHFNLNRKIPYLLTYKNLKGDVSSVSLSLPFKNKEILDGNLRLTCNENGDFIIECLERDDLVLGSNPIYSAYLKSV